MRKRTARTLVTLFAAAAAAMLLSLAASAATNYDLWVAGTQVTSDTLSGEGWSFEPDTNTLVLNGHITYVGRTSMEVRVDTFIESLSGERTLINTAYVVMVALDENDCPTPVPGLILTTDEEKAEWEAAKKRRAKN